MMPSSEPSEIANPTRGALWLAALSDVAHEPDEIVHRFDLAHVVCLVEDSELAPYPTYRRWLSTSPMATRLPIIDHGVPEVSDARDLGRAVAHMLDRGDNVLIHCHAGFGRSSLLAVAVLLHVGVDSSDAVRGIARDRPGAGPETDEQRLFIERLSTGRSPTHR